MSVGKLRQNKLRKKIYLTSVEKYFLLFTFFSLFLFEKNSGTPLNNIQDAAIMHTIYGTDKYYSPKIDKDDPSCKKTSLSLHFSPFFQHSGSASKAKGGKVPAGDINGRWNMFAIYYNPNATAAQMGNLNNYNAGRVVASTYTLNHLEGKDFTVEANFNPNDPNALVGSYQSVRIIYEKIGLRGQMSFDFAFGLGLVIKGGVANYKQIPTFTIDQNLQNRLAPPPDPQPLANPPIEDTQRFINEFLAPYPLNKIAGDLGLDLSEQRRIDLEDTHISLYWNMPFKIKEKGDLIMTLIPYVSIGAWLPLAQKKDQAKAFSLSLGNDGATGITAEGAFTFDFPDSIQIGLGGGGAFFTTQNLTNFRMPTSEFQAGIIPWTTNVTKEPGPMWYVNASFKIDNFMPDFSFYCDYIYTEHLRDTITLKEPNAARALLFLPEKSMRESSWKIQNFNAGIKYDLSSYCAFGVALQSTISSARTYRPTTFLGSIMITF